MYYHTDDERTIAWLENVLHRAKTNRLSVRLDVSETGSLKVKLGEGIWSAPLGGTPDPNRDTAPSNVIPFKRR